MTPGARVQAAIEILGIWDESGRELDRVLRDWGRGHRFAGSGDRRAIADLVYDALRRRRSATWVAGTDGTGAPRDWVRGSLILDGTDPASLFTGADHAPAPLTEAERAPPRPPADAPRAVRLDYPDWLGGDLAAIGETDLDLLRQRAPLDLRVNLLRGDGAAAIAALASEGIAARPLDLSPTALRVAEGARRVAGSRAYADGLVEIQDAASQAMADLAEVRPGETVLDLCAGGGGKTLALAAAMAGKGRLVAHDIAPARIANLPERAARAGAAVEIAGPGALAALAGRCDLVYVDAPCSGSGAWRRNPDAKWRLDPARLDALADIQARLLDQAVGLVAPGGRIAYVTCSILARENVAQVASFEARHPGWTSLRVRRVLPSDGGDGFFGAILKSAPLL